MRYVAVLVVVAGLFLGSSHEAKAQFSLSIGSPYYGTAIGSGYSSYGGYAPGYGYSNSVGYYGGYIGGPGVFNYSSGYGGLGRPAYYGNGIGNYYGGYGYAARPGFRPFRGGRRFYR